MRRKKMLSRKRAALRWLAALCLLLAACHFLELYCLTPGRALRRLERSLLTGRTSFLASAENPISRNDLRLSGGSETVILSGYGFSWREGWYTEYSFELERAHDAPFTVGLYQWALYREGQQTNALTRYSYVFGCVEDPAVTELEIVFSAVRGGHDQTARLTSVDWIAGEKRRPLFPLRPGAAGGLLGAFLLHHRLSGGQHGGGAAPGAGGKVLAVE